VEDVQTDVEAKTVVVQANEKVSPELMLEKLKKVRELNVRSHYVSRSVSNGV
jgi:hypothetical protein